MRFLLVALVALFLAGEAFAANGAFPNSTCSATSDAVVTFPTIKPGGVISWCPGSVPTQTQLVNVANMADCNYNGDTTGAGAGTVTLTTHKCSGSTTAANDCKNPLLDSTTASPTITSNTETGRFSLDSGVWLLTASGADVKALLRCTGR